MDKRIKELAEQAFEVELSLAVNSKVSVVIKAEHLERFADLVRQDERAVRGAVLRNQDKQIKEMQLTNARLFEKFNKAVLDEREACAKIIEDYVEEGLMDGHALRAAKTIRARSEPSPAFKNYMDDNWAGIV